jgi:universal stress protein A
MKAKPSKTPGNVLLEIGDEDERLLSATEKPHRENLPFKLKKILVPTDFSECSRKALQYAIPFAKQFNASILLLNIVPVNYLIGSEFEAIDFVSLEEKLEKDSKTHLAEFAQEPIKKQITTESLVKIGRPAHEIIQIAKEREIDLIIMSTHGHTRLKHIFIGSVTENVMRHAACPVLIVHEHEHDFVEELS